MMLKKIYSLSTSLLVLVSLIFSASSLHATFTQEEIEEEQKSRRIWGVNNSDEIWTRQGVDGSWLKVDGLLKWIS